MNAPTQISSPAFLKALTALELQVARRADELARAGVSTTELKLTCWLQAEQEILDVPLLIRVARDQTASRPFSAATAGGLKELPLGLR